MAVKLKSASINQTLQLALRVFFVALVALWMRSGGIGVVSGTLFLILYIFFYTRISRDARKFMPTALILAALVFLVPIIGGAPEITFISIWGILYFLLLNIKNLIIVNRQDIYRFLHLILIAILNILFFIGFGFISQIFLFIMYIFFFREFYIVLAQKKNSNITLIATIEAFLAVQVAWITSFLSINFIASAALLTLTIYIFHDLALHHLLKSLTKKIHLRDSIVFIVLTIIIFALAS